MFDAWCSTHRDIPVKHYRDDELGFSDDEDNDELPLEDLLLGPAKLNISFEYWMHLARQYLLEPNKHTPALAFATASGVFGVTEAEFNPCMHFYWRVVLAAWRFENAYLRVCFTSQHPVDGQNEALTELPIGNIRYAAPSALRVNNLFRINEKSCGEIRDSDNPYIEPEQFRAWHNGISHLTLQCCQGISTCLVPSTLATEHQLRYITEYASACEPCQDAEDYRVSLYTALGRENLHQPYFHPLYYSYPCRGKRTRENRILNATFFTNAPTWERHLSSMKRIEETQAPYFFEERPTLSEIMSTLICDDQIIAPA